MASEWWIGKDMEGLWSNLRYYFDILQEVMKETTKTSDRIGGLKAEFWTRHLPKTKQEC
jgi:hypothetical protein